MITADDLPEQRFDVGPFTPDLCPGLFWQAWWFGWLYSMWNGRA